jgi:uroporphyrinogen decarboxylase
MVKANTVLPAHHPLASGATSDAPLVRALRGERPERIPVWFMRQAGRSLPEYRKVRAGVGMLESCLRPDLASEITLQPVRRHGVDAAVFFSDIVVPLKLAGVGVDIASGVGPVMDAPVRTREDLRRLRELQVEDLAPVSEAVRITVNALGSTPLLGFAGAPFTLASYLVEGRPSREHLHTRSLMHADPDLWNDLLAWVARTTATFLRSQVLAGASAVQLFDSWVGTLSLPDYERFVAPHSRAVFEHVADLGVPRIHFGTNTGELLEAMRDVGADAMGIDHRIPLDVASARLGHSTVLQGNIDPALLFAPWPILEAHVRDVVRRGSAAPAHVLNLGHGVPPEADPDVISRVVELAHSITVDRGR